jgi:hypothetical protein
LRDCFCTDSAPISDLTKNLLRSIDSMFLWEDDPG